MLIHVQVTDQIKENIRVTKGAFLETRHVNWINQQNV